METLWKTKASPRSAKSQQKCSIDYCQTYSATMKCTSVRAQLSIVAHIHSELPEIHASTALLNGNVKEDNFVKVPDGVQKKDRNQLYVELQKHCMD